MKTLRSLWHTFFGDSARAFGSVSVIFLVLLAIAPAKDYFSEWRHYQKQYLHLIRGRADAVTLERHFQIGIQQIWIPEQQVTDRCTTCHEGLKESTLADVNTVVFRKHPVIPHSLTEFGCTTCHRGQGPATTMQEAHSSTADWEQPLLPAKYIEAGCGQCHLEKQTATPFLNQGPTDRELRLHALPHHKAGGRYVHRSWRRSAVAEPRGRQDNPRVDLCLDQRPTILCQHRNHAELSFQR